MRKLNSIIAILLVTLTACGQSNSKYPGAKTDAEWKKILSANTYQIMVKNGTEAPYKNAYFKNHDKGIYVSAATGEPLFSSDDKYNSGTGWPSFAKPLNSSAIKIVGDYSAGMVRQEVVEAKTGLHLGHVFNDGPKDKGGKRYCMNSGAFKFVEK